MAGVHDVATALVARLRPLTAMKLEKLVYYCQAWHLVHHGEPLFADRVEAWAEGPVVRELYREHRQLYWIKAWPAGDVRALQPHEDETVSWVVEKYGNVSAERLSRMTHAEAPWRVARGGLPDGVKSSSEISLDLMRTYYGRQVADPETAVALAAANSALEGVELDASWQERLREVATGLVDADALVAEEIAHARRE